MSLQPGGNTRGAGREARRALKSQGVRASIARKGEAWRGRNRNRRGEEGEESREEGMGEEGEEKRARPGEK